MATVTQSRLEEICEKIKAELKAANCQDQLAGGVLLTGGGSRIKGLPELFKKNLGLSVRHGRLREFDGLVDEISQQRRFLVAVGLMALGGVLRPEANFNGWKVVHGKLRQLLGLFEKLLNKIK